MNRAMSDEDRPNLRRGWTTGACATAAARAAYEALVRGVFPDPVSITLPNGARPAFALACSEAGEGFARAMREREAELRGTPVSMADLVAAIAKNKPSSGGDSAAKFAAYARDHGSN